MSLRHTVHQLPARMRARSDALDRAIQIFLRDTAAAVDREATRNLSGGGAPGTYPVPRRTGNLARQQGHSAARRTAVVWNAAPYAGAVHEGFQPYGNPRASWMPGRPFLTDAVAKVDPAARLQQALDRVP